MSDGFVKTLWQRHARLLYTTSCLASDASLRRVEAVSAIFRYHNRAKADVCRLFEIAEPGRPPELCIDIEFRVFHVIGSGVAKRPEHGRTSIGAGTTRRTGTTR